jgi:Zn-dependent peptidase ImmA (M78 family)
MATAEKSGRAHGYRFTALRYLHRLTQGQLAERLGVTQSFLSYVEKGDKAVPDSLAAAASQEFSLPLSFFWVQPSVMDSGIATFRKTSRVTVKDESRITTLYDESARLFRALSEATNFRTVELVDPDEFDHDPEQVAAALRRAAGISPTEPVLNATRTLERFGIGVVDRLDNEGHENTHVAVSRPSPYNVRPLVALAEDVPGAVKRATVLHEAYHLIADKNLTKPITSSRSPEEKRAFRFAGAFLLPEDVARERISESLNLHGYLPIKAEFGISVSMAIHRGVDLGLISPQRYRSLMIQWSSQGWRRHEPVDVADERPILLGQALRRVFGEEPVAKASHALGMSPEWIRRWTHLADGPVEPETTGKVIDFNAVHASRGPR